MPRSASPPFNYQVPSGTAAVSGQVISSVSYNNFLADLTNNALNAAWPVANGGTGTTDGSSLVPDGSAAIPAVRFQSETNTGFYRISAGTIGISILGVNAVTITSSGITFNGITSNGTVISTGAAAGYTAFQGISTNTGTALGPIDEAYRNKAAPAVNDLIGGNKWYGNSSAAVKREYVGLDTGIVDPTNAAERGFANFYTIQNGSRNLSLAIGATAYATTATAAGTTTLTKLSAAIQYFTGTTTQTVVLPAVTELFIGQRFIIENRSTGLVTVQSSGANTIQVMSGTWITFALGAPGSTLIVTCISNSGTGTASWDFEYTGPLTNMVAYTPTFTGFGTATNVNFFSRREGDLLYVRGKFTAGTTTATEARITLGFNGTNNNVTIDSTKNASIRIAGDWGSSGTGVGTAAPALLAEASVGYMTFGVTNATNAALTKQLANTVVTSSTDVAVEGWFPITG